MYGTLSHTGSSPAWKKVQETSKLLKGPGQVVSDNWVAGLNPLRGMFPH